MRAFYHTLAEMWSKRKQSSVDLLRSSEFTDGLETRIIVRRHLWSQFHKKVGPLKLNQLTDLLQHAAFKCAHIIYALKKKKKKAVVLHPLVKSHRGCRLTPGQMGFHGRNEDVWPNPLFPLIKMDISELSGGEVWVFRHSRWQWASFPHRFSIPVWLSNCAV